MVLLTLGLVGPLPTRVKADITNVYSMNSSRPVNRYSYTLALSIMAKSSSILKPKEVLAVMLMRYFVIMPFASLLNTADQLTNMAVEFILKEARFCGYPAGAKKAQREGYIMLLDISKTCRCLVKTHSEAHKATLYIGTII